MPRESRGMFHVKHSADDTIAAIATPPGVGGVGVVRISGDQSIRVAEQIIRDFPKNIIPQRVYHSWIACNGKPVDEVLYYFMKAPNSYTGEDVVEISGHGGAAVLREVLGLIVSAGARIADRGEFTRRAFLNGKVDILRAEAVLDLISARTGRGVEAAVGQLGGGLSSLINGLRSELVNILSEIEASIDFPDDVEEIGRASLRERIEGYLGEVDRLIETAEGGHLLREGLRMAIAGRPNVGKSSLLNALLGEDRAIVTDVPGTTRDTIEEVVNVNGLPVVVIDTAGIRHPRDKAEEFGVARARKEIGAADIVLVVLDASGELSDEDKMILGEARAVKHILALNKIDLGIRLSLNGWAGDGPSFQVSALRGDGVENLRKGIFDFVVGHQGLEGAGGVFINLRHKECLIRTREGLLRAIDSCSRNMPSDFVAIDIKGAIVALSEMSGEEVSEEVINSIFERFCVGK